MAKYKVKLPGGIYEVEADGNKEAIDQAVELFVKEIQSTHESGDLYGVPELYKMISHEDEEE